MTVHNDDDPDDDVYDNIDVYMLQEALLALIVTDFSVAAQQNSRSTR